VLGAMALLIVSLATRWRTARWAWVAWLPLALFGGGGVSGAMVFLLIALAGTDEWLAARAGVPISADARARIIRRASRPLLPVAVGAACLLALSLPLTMSHLHPPIADTRPAELARPLNAIPARMNDWVQASSDQPRDADMATILGTPNFLIRSYVNSRQLGGMQSLSEIRMRTPEAVVDVWITFYTGPDQLAREIPDRAAAADGYQSTGSTVEHWSALANRPGDHGVRFMSVPDSAGGVRSAISAIDRYIAYVYQCNGEYLSDPAAVRRRLSEPGAQRPYYAKIEVTMSGVAKEKVAQVMDAFLAELLPEVEKCLPINKSE
jgi:hypothetical protein